LGKKRKKNDPFGAEARVLHVVNVTVGPGSIGGIGGEKLGNESEENLAKRGMGPRRAQGEMKRELLCFMHQKKGTEQTSSSTNRGGIRKLTWGRTEGEIKCNGEEVCETSFLHSTHQPQEKKHYYNDKIVHREKNTRKDGIGSGAWGNVNGRVQEGQR